ncbi:hypothetical protein Z951_44645 [Streptomyces sp. PRh5]|uniref:hypothetical protein n=1 Tax=Streptomyces sp. PRh5 TaxID=1158056 RepID=UPI000445B9C8|nr:hypothetical protein [Streptomyces sp. PRh5]EXU61881.1 hypothetical protein Z951_44645 [Streptomyces sp. PRh5]
MTGSVAYLSERSSDPSIWFLPPFMICAHLVIGAFHGHLHPGPGFTAIALPPLVLLSTVAFGMAYSDMHDIDINPIAMATAWASIFTLGLLALTYTFRAWLGQIRHTTEEHRPRG